MPCTKRALSCLFAGLAAGLVLFPSVGSSEPPPPPPVPTATGSIEVTATKIAEDVEVVPASITIITGDELRARGVTDLQSAVATVGGVSIAPGGDGGPATSVPELWGLREFDAFLLVVDGVPWGGAFNPDLLSLDLNDVDRIEVLRGAAPVMFGATSFVGVIHVIHRPAGAAGGSARLSMGNYGSGSAALTIPLATGGGYRQSLSVSGEKQGFRDDRTDYARGLLLYRGAGSVGPGAFRLDVNVADVRQKPASPSPRTGATLDPLVPLDANQNPIGSKVDEDRFALVAAYDRPGGAGSWFTTLSYTHSHRTVGRGFLTAVSEDDPNANGFRQHLGLTDVYFDTHLALKLASHLQLVAGLDYLYGDADQHSEDFDYFAALDGTRVPNLSDLVAAGHLTLADRRKFAGLYAQAEWTPSPRWTIQLGGRLNDTHEDLSVATLDVASGDTTSGSDSKPVTRGSGTAGVNWLAYQGPGGAVWAFADVRSTFKPAALDFGPDADAEILNPETSKSVEIGLKGRRADGSVDWQISAFQMDFDNLVVPITTASGQPGLTNAGKERFKGVELELGLRLQRDLHWQFAYSYHDPRFTDYVRDFDGVPTRLDGNRLEMSAQNMAATGLVYSPSGGVTGSVVVNYVGERYLDMRNHALAPAYTTWSASVGYRFGRGEIRFEGSNLNDTRPPVSESELGDAQYYRLPARTVRLAYLVAF
jgi:iron complex outermembrane recepter protein